MNIAKGVYVALTHTYMRRMSAVTDKLLRNSIIEITLYQDGIRAALRLVCRLAKVAHCAST